MIRIVKKTGNIETLDISKIQPYTLKSMGREILNTPIVYSYQYQEINIDVRISKKGFICITSTEEDGNLILYKFHNLKSVLKLLLREVIKLFKYERIATFLKDFLL